MTGNRDEAEEIMQDAFLRLWERWERVSAMVEPVGFLYRTAMNLYRKRLRRAAVAVRKATNLLPHDALAAVEARDEATRLLRTLTPREREALVLTAYLGYSTEEAGTLLGIKANTVRVLTARCPRVAQAGRGGSTVIDEREIVRRAAEALTPPEPSFDRLLHRRNRCSATGGSGQGCSASRWRSPSAGWVSTRSGRRPQAVRP